MKTMLTQKDIDKKSQLVSQNIVKKSKLEGGGYGVFAGTNYNEGDPVEKCVFLELSNSKDSENVRPELDHYVFASHVTPGKEVLVFGNGSLFNHSDTPNLELIYDSKKLDKRIVVYRATKDIKKGDELFINYGKEWFNKHGMEKKVSKS
jgi:hypothetical protein